MTIENCTPHEWAESKRRIVNDILPMGSCTIVDVDDIIIDAEHFDLCEQALKEANQRIAELEHNYQVLLQKTYADQKEVCALLKPRSAI